MKRTLWCLMKELDPKLKNNVRLATISYNLKWIRAQSARAREYYDRISAEK